jgi:16S rRNA (adenine1518-N6/adenine1519-N6)-dimethyltransferase
MARAKKSLGQNFLVEPRIQIRIVEAIHPTPTDTVVEIGPGKGALTKYLAGRVHALIAVELDDLLAQQLQNEFKEYTGVTIVHMDALDFEPEQYVHDVEKLKIVGNIPYNITSPLLFHLLERRHRPHSLVVMVQKEVAIRIAAPPGSRDYGALSIGIQSVASVERLFNVARGAFRPVPNVDSAVLRISPIRPYPMSANDEIALRTFTRAAFQRRRKQLQTILRTAPEYALSPDAARAIGAEIGLDLERRPETLSIAELLLLTRALSQR